MNIRLAFKADIFVDKELVGAISDLTVDSLTHIGKSDKFVIYDMNKFHNCNSFTIIKKILGPRSSKKIIYKKCILMKFDVTTINNMFFGSMSFIHE